VGLHDSMRSLTRHQPPLQRGGRHAGARAHLQLHISTILCPQSGNGGTSAGGKRRPCALGGGALPPLEPS